MVLAHGLSMCLVDAAYEFLHLREDQSGGTMIMHGSPGGMRILGRTLSIFGESLSFYYILRRCRDFKL
jgi:hypothetical protein